MNQCLLYKTSFFTVSYLDMLKYNLASNSHNPFRFSPFNLSFSTRYTYSLFLQVVYDDGEIKLIHQ